MRNKTGKAISSVVSVMKMKRYNICFLTVGLHEWFGLRCTSMGPLQTSQYFKYVWKLAQWNTKILQISSPCRSGSIVLVCLALQKCCRFLEQTLFFFAGNILDYTLAPYMGYFSTGYFSGGACGGISVLRAGGQGVFYPDT